MIVLIRILIMLSLTAGGVSLGTVFTGLWSEGPVEVKWALVGLTGIVLGLIGYAIAPKLIHIVVASTKWVEQKLQKTPIQDIMSGAVGLIIGLIIANLLGVSIYRLPFVGPYLAILASLVSGYLGWSIGTKKREDIVAFSCNLRLGSKSAAKQEIEKKQYKILDTSVIIDGRIADICKSGFVEGVLLIPSFILEELRHIADSSDALKRNRGRRGLDILNKIRKELDIMVKIYEKDYDDIAEVDSKLVKLSQELKAQVITNDFNLNKVAELQGIKVLNINELANALKPVVLPGEEMIVQVIKDGKEMNQGIGYLDDGTMIVVENGRRYIGQTIAVLVTSVLQTAAGRMIFARPRGSEKRLNGEHQALEVNVSV
jgi:uncharacterized protein YacL